METIIIELIVPASNERFDFVLPAASKVDVIIQEMIRLLEAKGQNIAFAHATTQLCDIETAQVLDPGIALAQQGIRDGSQLMLV